MAAAKPIRTPIYMGNWARMTRLHDLRLARGYTSDSELVRHLIDEARLPKDQPHPVLGDLTLPRITLPRKGVVLVEVLAEVERQLVAQALQRTKGNKRAAAQLLGVSRETLRRKAL